jgi:chromosome partitioning protein
MKVLSLLSQKGGSGKSTLALHLAVAAESAGVRVAVVDLDPQASAASWKDLRQAETPVVVSAQASRLEQVLDAALKHGAGLAIIDTGPHSESAALAAARSSDLVLVPCRPSILDLKAISITLDLVKLAAKEAHVVLNAVPPRGSLRDQAVAAINTYNVPVCPVAICHRAAFVHALTSGKTAAEYDGQGKATQEIAALFKWVSKQLQQVNT